LSVDVDAIFRLRLCGIEMSNFRAELVQLIVRRSDSELEVQRYGMKVLFLQSFLPRDAHSAKRGIAGVSRPSVRPSVRL